MATTYYTVAGMMSGTSLDGIDLILCRFHYREKRWHYRVLKAVTMDYSAEWKKKLVDAAGMQAEEILLLHNAYGRYIGDVVKHSMKKWGMQASLVASHGHTIFHQPDKQFTFQLGSGAAIASQCGIMTVSDFRSTDVAFGGQGAPLVPVGDEFLFGNYAFCLNLGGFSNISHQHNGLRIACDLSPANIVLNNLAGRAGKEFDRNGTIGRRGSAHAALVDKLNALDFYALPAPKSLGREWVETVFMPVLNRFDIPLADLMRSVYEHVAFQISRYMNSFGKGEVLVTGGGAFNSLLVELIRQKTGSVLVIPGEKLVKFKEALIFAFLGLLRYRGEINCLASVTGARKDSMCGTIHLP